MGSKPRKKPTPVDQYRAIVIDKDGSLQEQRIGDPLIKSEAVAEAKEWAEDLINCGAVVEVVKIVGVAEVKTEVAYTDNQGIPQ